MSEHSSPAVESLLEAGHGNGGATLLVTGQPRSTALQRYWMGTRHSAVDTLFEGVLRCLLAGRYDEILAFTGYGDEHLPDWTLERGFRLGGTAMIWQVKGTPPPRPAAPPTQKARLFFEANENDAAFDDLRADLVPRLFWRSEELPYWERLRELLARRRTALQNAEQGRRIALVVDFAFIVPSPQEAPDLLANKPVEPRIANQITREFADSFTETPVDLIVFSESGIAGGLIAPAQDVDPGPRPAHVLAEAVAPSVAVDVWERTEQAVRQRLPVLRLCRDAREVHVTRAASPLPNAILRTDPVFPDISLYDRVRRATLDDRATAPSPPRHPQLVAIEFWATLDLNPLRAALDEEIIGQDDAKGQLLQILQTHKDRCAEVLATAEGAAPHITVKNKHFCLPVVGLFGAAGMGKSELLEILGRALFVDSRFKGHVQLEDKSLASLTVGVSPPWAGWDAETDLIRYARESGGLGVFCFDEVTRVMRPRGEKVGTALQALLPILEGRSFMPASPRFRPPGGTYHLANTLLVLAGNVEKGEYVGTDFTPIGDLGTPFLSRITRQIFFRPLAVADAPDAIRRRLLIQIRIYVRDVRTDAEPFLATPPVIEDQLVSKLVDVLVTQSDASALSFRDVAGLLNRLDLGASVNAARAVGRDRIVVGMEAFPEGGQA